METRLYEIDGQALTWYGERNYAITTHVTSCGVTIYLQEGITTALQQHITKQRLTPVELENKLAPGSWTDLDYYLAMDYLLEYYVARGDDAAADRLSDQMDMVWAKLPSNHTELVRSTHNLSGTLVSALLNADIVVGADPLWLWRIEGQGQQAVVAAMTADKARAYVPAGAESAEISITRLGFAATEISPGVVMSTFATASHAAAS